MPIDHSEDFGQLNEFWIDLENSDGCFAPGDPLIGYIVFRASNGFPSHPTSVVFDPPSVPSSPPMSPRHFELISLKIRFYGSARLKTRVKGMPSNRECVYLDEEHELLSQIPGDAAERYLPMNVDKMIKFQNQLPSTLCTSVESKSASILYTIRCSLIYKTIENELKTAHCVRAFTVVERFDIGHLPADYFQPAPHHLIKKFGMFSCTGGQIRLNFSICRSAFVCGENIIIEGRVENKTDRRVDKVSAVLQQVVVVHGDAKDSELNLLDVTDIHEDNLALFVDDGAAVKIERNFALPPLPPSTFALDGSEPTTFAQQAPTDGLGIDSDTHRNKRKAMSLAVGGNLMRKTSSTSSGMTSKLSNASMVHFQKPQIQRYLKVLYQLCVRVKSGGMEVMEINVPIVIGSFPPRKAMVNCEQNQPIYKNPFPNATQKQSNGKMPTNDGQLYYSAGVLAFENVVPMTVMFLQSRKEFKINLSVPNEIYHCSKSELSYTNKYPFYVNMPTSSKQSRKISVLANTIRAENSFSAAIRRENTINDAFMSQIQLNERPNNAATSQSQPKQVNQTPRKSSEVQMPNCTTNLEQRKPSVGALHQPSSPRFRSSSTTITTEYVKLRPQTSVPYPDEYHQFAAAPGADSWNNNIDSRQFQAQRMAIEWQPRHAIASGGLPPVEIRINDRRRASTIGTGTGSTVGNSPRE